MSASSSSGSSSATAPRLRVSPSYLISPNPLLSPTPVTLSYSINLASRSLSLASTHETSSHPRRYELAYPLYLRATRAFLFAARNLAGGTESLRNSDEEKTGEEDRKVRLKQNLQRQASKALQRAEQIRQVKGADWARRWAAAGGGYGGGSKEIEEQTRRLADSSRINGLYCEPWSATSPIGQDNRGNSSVFPLPLLSEKQKKSGAGMCSAFQVFGSGAGGGEACRIWDAVRPLRGEDITQDAVSNCGLVAAMEVIAEHDFKWQTKLLRNPLLIDDDTMYAAMTANQIYTGRLHINGCLRLIHIDDRLPFHATSDLLASASTAEYPHRPSGEQRRLMCASVRALPTSSSRFQASPAILLPSLVEKACLSILRTYAPPGSVPAEDLHLLTGWLPEVVHLQTQVQEQNYSTKETIRGERDSLDTLSKSTDHANEREPFSKPTSSTIQREKTFRRIYEAWIKGLVLICAGTGSGTAASPEDGGINHYGLHTRGMEDRLVPSHSYAVLGMDNGQGEGVGEGSERGLTLMNPWRPATRPLNTGTETDPARQTMMPPSTSPFKLSWENFLKHFSTLHLAWNPIALFEYVDEVHGSWEKADEIAGTRDDGTAESEGQQKARMAAVRDVTFTLRVTCRRSGIDDHQTAQSTTTEMQYEHQTLREGAGEVWLHLSRHSKHTKGSSSSFPFPRPPIGPEDDDSNTEETCEQGEPVFIAIHVYEVAKSAVEGHQDSRVVAIGGEREGSAGGIYVNTCHHLMRFKPCFLVDTLRQSSDPPSSQAGPISKEYQVVLSLHAPPEEEREDVNFTLRAWSRYEVAIEEVEEEPGWTSMLRGSWTSTTSGGHLLCPSFPSNPQYLLTLPSNSPGTSLTLTLSATPPLPVHILLVHSPHLTTQTSRVIRVDRVERGDMVAQSGAYSSGFARVKVTLAATARDQGGRYHLILSTFQAGTEGKFNLKIQGRNKVAVSERVISVAPAPVNLGSTATGLEGMTEGGTILLNPILPEGAGMFAKKEKARWSCSKGTAGGAPRFGRYCDNPAWIVKLGEMEADDKTVAEQQQSQQLRLQLQHGQQPSARAVFRLRTEIPASAIADASTTTLPLPINLSLFHLPTHLANRPSLLLRRADGTPVPLSTTGPYTPSTAGVALHEVFLKRGESYLLVASSFQSGQAGEAEFTVLGWCAESPWTMKRVG